MIQRKSVSTLEGSFFGDIWNTISQGVPQAVSNVIGEVQHSASGAIQDALGITPTPTATTIPPVVVQSAPAVPTWVYYAGAGLVAVLVLPKVLKARR